MHDLKSAQSCKTFDALEQWLNSRRIYFGFGIAGFSFYEIKESVESGWWECLLHLRWAKGEGTFWGEDEVRQIGMLLYRITPSTYKMFITMEDFPLLAEHELLPRVKNLVEAIEKFPSQPHLWRETHGFLHQLHLIQKNIPAYRYHIFTSYQVEYYSYSASSVEYKRAILRRIFRNDYKCLVKNSSLPQINTYGNFLYVGDCEWLAPTYDDAILAQLRGDLGPQAKLIELEEGYTHA